MCQRGMNGPMARREELKGGVKKAKERPAILKLG